MIEGPRRGSAAARVAALFLACFGLLPIANWIPGGQHAPAYADVLGGWWSGTLVVLGVAVILGLASRKFPALWRDGGWGRLVARARLLEPRRAWIVGAAALAVYLVVSFAVFSARPLLIDELIQTWQARIYATGHLWIPAPVHPEFTSVIHQVNAAGKVYGQFPAGGPAMILLGTLVGAEWLVGPLCGALTVVAFAWWLRKSGESAGIGTAALLILAFAPFTLFMAGSYMNHVTSLAWIVVGMAALAAVVSSTVPRPGRAALMGLAFGLAATIRPVDGFVFGAPAGLWLLWRALRDPPRWRDCLAAGAAMAIPIVLLMWVNVHTTGRPLLFGYTVEWGPDHDLGFHRAPWGVAHTPAHGLQLVSLYFLELGTYFLETPFPALLPATIALLFWRGRSAFDRYLLLTGALVVGFYFAYWHNGFYLGPRFMYPLLPALALWTARCVSALRARFPAPLVRRTAVYGTLVGMVLAGAVALPIRVRSYRNGMLSPRWPVDAEAKRAGVQGALVFVRESWGSTLMARMWAIGVSRPQAEMIYRSVDACALDSAIAGVERLRDAGNDSVDAYGALAPLLRDSARVIASPLSPDTTEHVLPGARYRRECVRRILEDRAGVALLTPLILARAGDNVYVRDLYARDTLMLAAYPGRPVYLLRPATAAVDDVPRFHPISRDSMWAEARGAPETASPLSASGPVRR